MTIISSSTENDSGEGFSFSSNKQIAIIQADVTVASSVRYGVYSNTESNTLINYGNIVALNFSGVASIDNTITIYNKAGASIFGHNGILLNSDGSEIINSGDIEGVLYGISVAADYSEFVNSGTISGYGAGIYAFGGSQTYYNSGTISGSYAMELSSTQGDFDNIENSGVLDGGVYGFLDDGSANLTFRNTGTIDGIVQLGNGSNTFNGRGGVVNDSVTGGSGTDKILAGNDGETIGGGNGHDRLYGGAGADTFAFSSFSAADTDVVKGFNVANDTIQLDHTVFTHLAVDQTPTFAIGTNASSTTDFLFYNSSTGLLFYDVDGSGTAHPSYEIANLGKGLHLTAADISVV